MARPCHKTKTNKKLLRTHTKPQMKPKTYKIFYKLIYKNVLILEWFCCFHFIVLHHHVLCLELCASFSLHCQRSHHQPNGDSMLSKSGQTAQSDLSTQVAIVGPRVSALNKNKHSMRHAGRNIGSLWKDLDPNPLSAAPRVGP